MRKKSSSSSPSNPKGKGGERVAASVEPAAHSDESSEETVEVEVEVERAEQSASNGNGRSEPIGDPSLPAGVAGLLELFGKQLGGVAFPDVSAASLEQAARDLATRTQALETARTRLAKAGSDLETSRANLLRLASRALAYARVFASDDAELSEALQAIRLESDKPQAARGRPRKQAAAVEPVSAAVPEPEPTPEATA